MRKHSTAARSTVFAARDASIVKRFSAAASSPVRNSHSARWNSKAKHEVRPANPAVFCQECGASDQIAAGLKHRP